VPEGRVIRTVGPNYIVLINGESIVCSVRKSVKESAEIELSPVIVGDQVEIEIDEITPSEGKLRTGVITEVKPRQTVFLKRRARFKYEKAQAVVANIDQMIIVGAVKEPQFKMRLIDRFLIAAQQGGMSPLIVINKIDLEHDLDINRIRTIYATIGVDVITASAKIGLDIDTVREKLRDRESVFVGQSGVGKSSLLNAIQPGFSLRVGDVSGKTGKGTHTTTNIELFPLDTGGYVVDTPGLRALGLTNLNRDNIDRFYAEISEAAHNCKFSDCTHRSEPSCAVKQAVKENRIFPERYESYLRILDDFEE